MIDPIENKLKDAILTETPDMLEDLMQELSLQETNRTDREQRFEKGNTGGNGPFTAVRSGSRKYLWVSAIAVAAVLFFIAGMAFSKMRSQAVPENAAETSPAVPGPSSKDGEASTAVSGPSSVDGEASTASGPSSEAEESAPANLEASPAAIVCLDVNPSIEFSVDGSNHILSYKAVNREAEELLADLDLTGADIRVASYAVVGAMLTSG